MKPALVTMTQPIYSADVERLIAADLEVRDLRSEQPLERDSEHATHDVTPRRLPLIR